MWEFWRAKIRKPRDGRASPIPGVDSLTEARVSISSVVNFKDLTLGPGLEDEVEEYEEYHSTHGSTTPVHRERNGLASAAGDAAPTVGCGLGRDSHGYESGYEVEAAEDDATNKQRILSSQPSSFKVPERHKLVIILVGLPGRGKTFLCNKLRCYLNWLGHNTRHFNVGSYRRQQKSGDQPQDADFFDHHNPAGVEARNKALHAALDDLLAYLRSSEGQVAIFDATNTTNERRMLLRERFHGRFQYLFIESICNDPKVLEQNYKFKMQYSPDYQGVDMSKALDDFKDRIGKYQEVYEPIEDRNLHYIKLIDMVTGRGYMDVNRISGYIPGKIVFFLMQVCKAGMAQARKIWLTRHGESIFNTLGRIGGDSGLSPCGEEYARRLPNALIDRIPLHHQHMEITPSPSTTPPAAQQQQQQQQGEPFASPDPAKPTACTPAGPSSVDEGRSVLPPLPHSPSQQQQQQQQQQQHKVPQLVPVSVWTSTLRRTIATARYLPFPKLRWKALDEIHAGMCDGLTYKEIEERYPDEYEARNKDKLRYRYPAGESYLDVIQRLEPVVIEMEREKECICVVGHQAVLRAILGYFMAVPLKDIPNLDIPLHSVIELRPRPDGTMEIETLPVPLGSTSGMSGGSADAATSKLSPCQIMVTASPGSAAAVHYKIPYGAIPGRDTPTHSDGGAGPDGVSSRMPFGQPGPFSPPAPSSPTTSIPLGGTSHSHGQGHGAAGINGANASTTTGAMIANAAWSLVPGPVPVAMSGHAGDVSTHTSADSSVITAAALRGDPGAAQLRPHSTGSNVSRSRLGLFGIAPGGSGANGAMPSVMEFMVSERLAQQQRDEEERQQGQSQSQGQAGLSTSPGGSSGHLLDSQQGLTDAAGQPMSPGGSASDCPEHPADALMPLGLSPVCASPMMMAASYSGGFGRPAAQQQVAEAILATAGSSSRSSNGGGGGAGAGPSPHPRSSMDEERPPHLGSAAMGLPSTAVSPALIPHAAAADSSGGGGDGGSGGTEANAIRGASAAGGRTRSAMGSPFAPLESAILQGQQQQHSSCSTAGAPAPAVTGGTEEGGSTTTAMPLPGCTSSGGSSGLLLHHHMSGVSAASAGSGAECIGSIDMQLPFEARAGSSAFMMPPRLSMTGLPDPGFLPARGGSQGQGQGQAPGVLLHHNMMSSSGDGAAGVAAAGAADSAGGDAGPAVVPATGGSGGIVGVSDGRSGTGHPADSSTLTFWK